MKASDFNGNESTLPVSIERASSFEPPSTPSPNVRHGHIQTVNHKNLGVTFFPSSLARDIAFDIKSIGDDTATQFEMGITTNPFWMAFAWLWKFQIHCLPKTNCVWSGLEVADPWIMAMSWKWQPLYHRQWFWEICAFCWWKGNWHPSGQFFQEKQKGSAFKFRIRDNIQTSASARAFTYNVWVRRLMAALWIQVVVRDTHGANSGLISRPAYPGHWSQRRGNLSRWQSDFTKNKGLQKTASLLAVREGFEPPQGYLAKVQNLNKLRISGQPKLHSVCHIIPPRDRRACLPISTPHIIITKTDTFIDHLQCKDITKPLKIKINLNKTNKY